ncbi:MAG: hypothetical protein EHM28_03210 [Spirochaetaceae bacterium]|nr:MAG: hypothetical protein EHM28_03210 [Spirochaetaceae bacterium]
MKNAPVSTIDQYIRQAPREVQAKLKEMRAIIKSALPPETTEKISYQMPTFFLRGNLVHFAAFKNHIGFYPTPTGVSAFEKELEKYETSKGAIQFPFGKPLPAALIKRIVKYRASENLNKK